MAAAKNPITPHLFRLLREPLLTFIAAFAPELAKFASEMQNARCRKSRPETALLRPVLRDRVTHLIRSNC